MLQWFVQYVASVCSQCFICLFRLCMCVYLDVVYISHICCKCFIWMLRMFAMGFKCFLHVFASVSDTCFKYFISLILYVVIIILGCFKSRSDVVSSSSPSAASPWSLLLTFCCLVSFSVCGGSAPGDGGADASARSPLPLCGKVELRFTFFCYTWDAEICYHWWAWD